MVLIASPDLPVQRYKPDPELLVRAHNHMLDEENDRERFIRQRWQEAFGGVRVALAAVREIYPAEREVLSVSAQTQFAELLDQLTAAYAELDDLSEEMLGLAMIAVMNGEVKTVEEFDEVVKQADDEEGG